MTKRISSIIAIVLTCLCSASAQVAIDQYSDGFTVVDNSFNPNRALDSLSASHKKVPKGLKVWTIDDKFGDITRQRPDTLMHLFFNTVFTSGRYGEYNTTGNLGSPRIARIATDRNFSPRFAFTEPYSYFLTDPTDLRFTNTLSPITHLYYHSGGGSENGDDRLKAMFATNINKIAGFGFKFDYVYGRGYYQNQNIALFDYTMWGSYIGQRYQAHLILSFDHMKNSENGGILNDEYITHPEAQSQTYSSDEIPTALTDNWNRNNAFHATLSHRYNIGFNRKVEMNEDEKEARRFALKAKEEREGLENSSANTANAPKGRPESAVVTKTFKGRPDNAKIVGDLPTDSLRNKITQANIAEMAADSLLASADSLANDTTWMKDEYVPVTSFIHTLQLDNHTRTYIAYASPSNCYANLFDVPFERAEGNNIYDETSYFSLRNTFAIGLLEGFNKYVPMGAKVFLAHDMRHYKLPDVLNSYSSYNETDISAGVQIEKTKGKTLHYKATGELTLVGEDIGDVKIDGTGDINLPLFKDTVNVALKGFYHLTNPTFLQRHYHSKHFWWDNDGMNKQMHTHLEGVFSYQKTNTKIRVAYDNLQNYAYLAESYDRASNGNIQHLTATTRQTSKNISLVTVGLEQTLKTGILTWENRLTFQKSTDNDILAVPTLNYWTNLFIDFRIAKVLRVNFGAEMFWFSKYEAPEYLPQLGQYAVQENPEVKTSVGAYPLVNVYCNFRLKQCRFYVMMSHVNSGMGSMNYFLTPHHPLNERMLRLGLAWTFHN